MKKFLFISVLFIFASTVNSQNMITIGLGQSFSSIKYIDSEGKYDFDAFTKINYSHSIQFNRIIKNHWVFTTELGYKKWGAKSIFDQKQINWDFHYVDLNIGAGYFIDKWTIKPYIGTLLGYSFLIQGYQTIGDKYFDIKTNESIKNYDYGITPFIGVNYPLMDKIILFGETRYSFGLNQLETNKEEDSSEELYNRAFAYQIGVRFKF